MADVKTEKPMGMGALIAIAAGVSGVTAYAVNAMAKPAKPVRTHVVGPGDGSENARPKSKSGKKSGGRKAGKTSAAKKPPSAYTRFVQAKMPALLARGYSSPDAMKEIGRLWRAQK